MQFALIRVSLDDLAELIRGLFEVVPLKRANARLVNRDGLVIPGFSRRSGWARSLRRLADHRHGNTGGCDRRTTGAAGLAAPTLFPHRPCRFLPGLFRHSIQRFSRADITR